MNDQPQAEHANRVAVQEEKLKVEVTVAEKTTTEKVEVMTEETNEEARKKYEEALKKYEQGIAQIKTFGEELRALFHKSQDTFEKQLSYISAGALALSVGFIKDIVSDIKRSGYKWMLITGWGFLIFTLLLNLVSHMLAALNAKKGAKETEDIDNAYDPKKIDKRANRLVIINWATVFTLASGIILIVLYITFNAIYER